MTGRKKYTTSNRRQDIDILKGIAIILVVLGHVICDVYDNKTANENIIFKICYSFHMPLFIFLSGYLTGERISRFGYSCINGHWLLKRVQRLLVPFFVWTLIKLSVQGNLSALFFDLFITPLYWFLINLFLYDVITFISIRAGQYFLTPWIISILLYALFSGLYLVYRNNNLVIKNVVLYCFFYFIGLFWNKLQTFRIVTFVLKKKKAFWVLYPASMILFTYKAYNKYAPIVAATLGINNTKIIIAAMYFYNHIIVALLGIGFAWIITDIIEKKSKKITRVLSFLGTRTLEIYVIHEFCFCYTFDPLINAIISMTSGILIPVIISISVQKFKPVKLLLFGY